MHLIKYFQNRPIIDIQKELTENPSLFDIYLEREVIPYLCHPNEIYYKGDEDYLNSCWFLLHPTFLSNLNYPLFGVIGTGCFSTCYLSKKNDKYCVVLISNVKYDPKILFQLKSIHDMLQCTCEILDILTYKDSIAVYDKESDYYNHHESRLAENPSSIVELDADKGEYVILVHELLTPLNFYIKGRVIDTEKLSRNLYEIYDKLDSYGLNYADPKLDNFAISIDGKLKFIDLEFKEF